MNTILDDISAVIGFSATLKLAAWFGDGISNCFVPATLTDDSVLVKLIGQSAAQRLVQEFPRQHLAVPSLRGFELETKRRTIARLITHGISPREIALLLKISEKRVQQIEGELVAAKLLERVSTVHTGKLPPADTGFGKLSDTTADTAMRCMVVAAKKAASKADSIKPAKPIKPVKVRTRVGQRLVATVEPELDDLGLPVVPTDRTEPLDELGGTKEPTVAAQPPQAPSFVPGVDDILDV